MLDSFPERPLTIQEVETLALSENFSAAFPAAPESIVEHEPDELSVYDVMLFDGPVITVVAYEEEIGGWTVIERQDESEDEAAFELVLQAVLDHRGYDTTTEDMKGVIKKALARSIGMDVRELEEALE